VQYVFLWTSGAPNSRAVPGSTHSSYATVEKTLIWTNSLVQRHWS